MAQTGSPLYLSYQMFDGSTYKYVKAHLFDAATMTEITGSPVPLTHLALGLYVNNGTLVMPNTSLVLAQYISYQDADYSLVDTVEGIAVDTFTVLDTGILRQVGDSLVLSAQMANAESDVYVRAYLYDAHGTQIAGSPVNLQHVSNGLYLNNTLAMPNTPMVRAQYKFYSDSGYSSSLNLDSLDLFFLVSSGGYTTNLSLTRTAITGRPTVGRATLIGG